MRIKLHHKISAICALLGFFTFLACLAFTGFSFYNEYEMKMRGEMQSFARQTSIQIENKFDQMDAAAVEVISTPNYIQALKNLAYRNSKALVAPIDQDYLLLRNGIMAGRTKSLFHRMAVFNIDGQLFTDNEDRVLSQPIIRTRVNSLPWLDEVRQAEGRRVILSIHSDIWSDSQQSVFSVARLIRDPGKEIKLILKGVFLWQTKQNL